MKAEGLNFAYNQAGINPGNWQIFYDFMTSGGVIPSLSGANPRYEGIPSSETTGRFSGQYVYIPDSDHLRSTQWNMMFVFEKNTNRDGILFSNYHGGTLPSGFALGVNSANRLYLEHYDSSGPRLYEAGLALATKNAVMVSKSENRLEFTTFDFNKKTINTDGFSVNDSTFLPSDNWYIGRAVDAPDYFQSKPFKGHLDAFAYITGIMLPPERATLLSGLLLAEAPEYAPALLEEFCSYSYVNLTGSVSNVTFDLIDNTSAIFHAQTGYLFNNTGNLWGNLTGEISNGFGWASGYLSGSVVLPSGQWVSNTGFVSGFSGFSTIGVGMRVFQSTIPSGVNSHFIPFPAPFSVSPVVFTELNNRFPVLEHNISSIESSGFTVHFSNQVPSTGCVITTTAGPPQLNSDFKLFSTPIPFNVESFEINFPEMDVSNPKVFCQISSDSNKMFSYGVSNISDSSFRINFSNRLEDTNVVLHTLVTKLGDDEPFRLFSTGLNSGANTQFIPFQSPFTQPPIVFGEITNSAGEDIVLHQISGVTNVGFHIALSNALPSQNYNLNVLAWSGAQSGVGYSYESGKQPVNLGRVADTFKNIYEIQAEKDAAILTQHDLPLYRSVYATGITGSSYIETVYNEVPIFELVDFNFSGGSGQNATFNHLVQYINNSSNAMVSDHTLTYSGNDVQPEPFTVYKNCYQAFGYKLEEPTYDDNYIYGFGMDGVSYFKEAGHKDFSELYVFPDTHNKTNLDIDAIFDRARVEFFTFEDYSQGGLNAYLNGLALRAGSYWISGEGYNQRTILDADYFITGSYLRSNGLFQGEDNVVFDAISGQRRFRNVPQSYTPLSGSVYLPNFHKPTDGYYLNGVKLTSGKDYTTEGSHIKLTNPNLASTKGLFLALPLDPSYSIRYTGEFDFQRTEKFPKGTSMLWANGVRQNLDEQYLEIASISLLTGVRNYIDQSLLIFDGNPTFLEPEDTRWFAESQSFLHDLFPTTRPTYCWKEFYDRVFDIGVSGDHVTTVVMRNNSLTHQFETPALTPSYSDLQYIYQNKPMVEPIQPYTLRVSGAIWRQVTRIRCFYEEAPVSCTGKGMTLVYPEEKESLFVVSEGAFM